MKFQLLRKLRRIIIHVKQYATTSTKPLFLLTIAVSIWKHITEHQESRIIKEAEGYYIIYDYNKYKVLISQNILKLLTEVNFHQGRLLTHSLGLEVSLVKVIQMQNSYFDHLLSQSCWIHMYNYITRILF